MAEGQVELFDPPATRRIVTGFARRDWCGVDPSTRRCAIAVLRADGRREVRTVSFSSRLSGAARLAAIYTGVAELYGEMGAGVGVVIVEQPSGKQPNPELSYAVGATLAGIGSVDSLQAPHVEMVASSRWKKVACGSGAIYKPKVSEQREYGVLAWARAAGYDGSSWDEADALGIAEYARKTFALEPR